MSKTELYLLFVVVIFCILALLTDYGDEVIEEKHYCDMVKIYKDSMGQFGWPPYKGPCNDNK